MLEWTAEYGGATALTYYRLEKSMDRFEARWRLSARSRRGDLEVITVEEFAEKLVL